MIGLEVAGTGEEGPGKAMEQKRDFDIMVRSGVVCFLGNTRRCFRKYQEKGLEDKALEVFSL